jgi:alkylation response protein AidB-like acyl-CoA dehydrogenase
VTAEHLDLDYSEEQQALADSVRGFVSREADPAVQWKGLAELGVLGLGTAEGGGGVLEIAAVMEALGHVGAPGPFAGTFMATQLVGPPDRERLAAGEAIVALGVPPLLPWAAVADVFVELAGDEAWLARPRQEVVPVETMAGEPWGRVELERVAPLGRADRAVVVGDVAVAAYLVGAAEHLVGVTAQWLSDREQFGRPIGEFQSLSHPLADVAIRTRAARGLTRLAAHEADTGDDTADTTSDQASSAAATARLSATEAALGATYRAHQSFGALGFTVEGPVAAIGQRIRQVSLHPPGPRAAREAVLVAHGL